jgi:hypothetical protein
MGLNNQGKGQYKNKKNVLFLDLGVYRGQHLAFVGRNLGQKLVELIVS